MNTRRRARRQLSLLHPHVTSVAARSNKALESISARSGTRRCGAAPRRRSAPTDAREQRARRAVARTADERALRGISDDVDPETRSLYSWLTDRLPGARDGTPRPRTADRPVVACRNRGRSRIRPATSSGSIRSAGDPLDPRGSGPPIDPRSTPLPTWEARSTTVRTILDRRVPSGGSSPARRFSGRSR